MKPKQLKRLKNRHRQQRLSLFLRQAYPKSKGANYAKPIFKWENI